MADAAALYAHLEVHDVRIVKGICDTDFGLRCFVFADPDGNRIDVGEAVTRNRTSAAQKPSCLTKASTGLDHIFPP
nr:VOC family protein [Pandoraea apista]